MPVAERKLTKYINCLNAVLAGKIPYIHMGIILLLAIASYANSLYVPLQFDDELVVKIASNDNSDLYSIQGFIRKSRWFTDITFALNRQLHGENVLGYHLFNLAIHLLCAGVVYVLIQQAIEALKRNYLISDDDQCGVFLRNFIPFAAAALFVCHPVQTQAVTYIIQRYTSLATLLYLSSLLFYLLARLAIADDSKKQRRWLYGFVCIFFALLAMKSKETAFTLPLMIAVLEFTLFRGQLLKSRFLLATGALLVLVIPLQLIISHGGTGNPGSLLNQLQLATTETQTISRTDYLLTQFRVVATYLRLLLLPVNQNLDYDYPVFHSLLNPEVLAALLLHTILLGAAVALFIRSKRQFASGPPAAGVTARLASLGILWFYLALSVESSLIPIRDVIFEHRVYLPSVGFFMATAAGMAGVAACRQLYRNVLWGAVVLICFVFAAGTVARNRIWSDEMLLWQDVIKKSPNKARAKYNVGLFYCRKKMVDQALPYLVRSLELDSGKDECWLALNAAVPQLGSYKNRSSTGYEYLVKVVNVDSKYRKEWLAISYNNLGLAYEYLGNQYLARENFLKSVTFNPALDLAWYNLALIAAHLDDKHTVSSAMKALSEINPRLELDAAQIIRE